MPTEIDYSALKAGGIIKQKQPDLFAVRVRIPLGNIDSDTLAKLAELAKRYGQGQLHLTMRQGFEIPYVHFKDVDALTAELADLGLVLGACGPRVRVVTACQGSALCPHGLGDTGSLALKLDERFYGRSGLPHKFKMAVTGCPNACIKPHENDLGFVGVAEPLLAEPAECIECSLCAEVCQAGAIRMVEGRPVIDFDKCHRDGKCVNVCPTAALQTGRQGWDMFVGGKFGKEPQLGKLFAEFVSEKQAIELVEGILKAYVSLASKGERIGGLINRIGLQAFKEAVGSVGETVQAGNQAVESGHEAIQGDKAAASGGESA